MTFGPNPSPTHVARIFSQIILFAIIYYIDQKYLAYIIHKRKILAKPFALCIKHFNQNHNFTNQNYPVNGPALMPYVFINCITHWEAHIRQSCYAAGQSSVERASDKDSLLQGHRFVETQS